MFKFFKRLWRYLGAAGNEKFNEKADPKIQLQQAITEAQDQHRRLKEHAANVIATAKQAEMQLDRKMEELEKLDERKSLLSTLEQARMQEQMNKSMASLSETVGQDVPTLAEVRDKIETRYAKAKGMAELTETSVESNMVEIEAAAQNDAAKSRLDAIREQMGIATEAEVVVDAESEELPASTGLTASEQVATATTVPQPVQQGGAS